MPLCGGVYILTGFQLLSPWFPLFFPPSLPSVTVSPSSRALIISVPPWPRHPFLFSEPEALSPSQAVSPHLSPPSSHQYPSISRSPRKQSDPSVCCRLSASRLSAISLTLPLLWVNMTHASIILLSFCHYYAPWTPSPSLSMSLLLSPSLCLSLAHPSVRLTLLFSSLRWWQILLSDSSHLSRTPPLLQPLMSSLFLLQDETSIPSLPFIFPQQSDPHICATKPKLTPEHNTDTVCVFLNIWNCWTRLYILNSSGRAWVWSRQTRSSTPK